MIRIFRLHPRDNVLLWNYGSCFLSLCFHLLFFLLLLLGLGLLSLGPVLRFRICLSQLATGLSWWSDSTIGLFEVSLLSKFHCLEGFASTFGSILLHWFYKLQNRPVEELLTLSHHHEDFQLELLQVIWFCFSSCVFSSHWHLSQAFYFYA